MLPSRKHHVFTDDIELVNLTEEINLLEELLTLDPANQKYQTLYLRQTQRRYAVNQPQLPAEEMDGVAEIASQISNVDAELREYGLDPEILDDDFSEYYHQHRHAYIFASPRIRFLANKRQRLLELQKIVVQQTEFANAKLAEKTPSKLQAVFSTIFDVGKKFIDLIDDLWNAIGKSVLPKELVEKVTPYLVGPVGAIIHFAEAGQGLWMAFKAIAKDKTRLRKTKIVTGLITAVIGGTGAGLGITYIAGAAGAAVLGYPLMPVLIPALLTVIYGVALVRNVMILRQVKKEVADAEIELQDVKRDCDLQIQDLERQTIECRTRKTLLLEANSRIIENIRDQKVTDREETELEENDIEIAWICNQEFKLDKQIVELRNKISAQEDKVEKLKEKQRKAEREVAFKVVEISASLIVLVGTILGTAAILGAASVATMGALPIALLVVGVAIGVGLKIFEKVDEKKGHKYSNRICGWFKNLFGSKSEPAIAAEPANRAAPELQQAPRSPSISAARFARFARSRTIPIPVSSSSDSRNHSSSQLPSPSSSPDSPTDYPRSAPKFIARQFTERTPLLTDKTIKSHGSTATLIRSKRVQDFSLYDDDASPSGTPYTSASSIGTTLFAVPKIEKDKREMKFTSTSDTPSPQETVERIERIERDNLTISPLMPFLPTDDETDGSPVSSVDTTIFTPPKIEKDKREMKFTSTSDTPSPQETVERIERIERDNLTISPLMPFLPTDDETDGSPVSSVDTTIFTPPKIEKDKREMKFTSTSDTPSPQETVERIERIERGHSPASPLMFHIYPVARASGETKDSPVSALSAALGGKNNN